MPEYDVILTRDLTESTTVRVTADNVSKAEEAALEKAGRNGDDVDGWENDSNNFSHAYATGCDRVN